MIARSGVRLVTLTPLPVTDSSGIQKSLEIANLTERRQGWIARHF
jgi:hypothetical protein